MDCQQIITLLEKPLSSKDFELVDVAFFQQEDEPTLQILIDHIDGINLEKCQKANQIIDEILEQQDITLEHYILEVSSPGVFRPLKEPKHYQRFVGSQIKVHLQQSIDHKNCYQGVLESADESCFQIKQGEQSLTFEYSQISKANLDPDL